MLRKLHSFWLDFDGACESPSVSVDFKAARWPYSPRLTLLPSPQLSQMEQEYSLKEKGLDARVQELEESSRSSSVDLTRLLTAQQKSTQRWKEEAKNLVQAFETKITALK